MYISILLQIKSLHWVRPRSPWLVQKHTRIRGKRNSEEIVVKTGFFKGDSGIIRRPAKAAGKIGEVAERLNAAVLKTVVGL